MSRITRRRALAGALALPAVLRGAAPAGAAVSGDAAVLSAIRSAEALALTAYEQVAREGATARVRALAQRFAEHERAHLGALATVLDALGAAPGPPPPSPLMPARARAQLRGLVQTEEGLVALWVDAHHRLGEPDLVRLATQVLGCQAQHLVALRLALGREPLPPAAGSS